MPEPTTITLDDFERCTIPCTQWNHRAHLTIAYLLLRAHPFDEALNRMRRGVQRFNAHNNIQQTFGGPENNHTGGAGYHETLTIAWMHILHATINAYGPGASADDFLTQHPHLQSKTLLRLYYTRARIMSDQARREFVPPDIAPFPKSP